MEEIMEMATIGHDQRDTQVSPASLNNESVHAEATRKERQHVTLHPGCDCEFKYKDYTWKKFTEYEPSRNGVEIHETYVVSRSNKELFTYAEGSRASEHRFPFVCGEIVSTKKLASAGKLKDVYVWLQLEKDAESSDRPLHVQQRHEGDTQRTLTSLPLIVDKRSKVVVFRTCGDSLFVQLMPTIRSEHKLVPGTPLFDKNNRGLRAAVGNMFSQHDYVVNCIPTEFCEIPIRKNKYGSDRLRVICLDRRGRSLDRKPYTSPVLNLVNLGIDAVFGGDTGGSKSLTDDDGQGSATTPNDESTENEIIYSGVVNDKHQVTDSFTVDKKNKPPKSVVYIAIDDDGVSVRYVDETERVVFNWINNDPKTNYSVMPRRFFNAKASVVAINTAARTTKKDTLLKRYKSLERLI